MKAYLTPVLRLAFVALAAVWSCLGQAAQPSILDTRLSRPEFLGSQVRLGWNSAGELQAAPSPNGPWESIDVPTLRESAATVPVVPGHKFFRVVDNGQPTAPMPLVDGDPTRPFKIDRAFIRKAAVSGGNAVLEAELTAGQNPPPSFPVLQDNRVLVLRDDGQGGDAAAGDGVFTAALQVDEAEFIAANEFIKSLPPAFRVSGNFSGREAVSGVLPTVFDVEAFLAGERIQVHPSPFDGRGLIPDGFAVPNGGAARAGVRRTATAEVVEICLTNVVQTPVVVLTNVLISVPDGLMTNVLCEPRIVGTKDRFLTNVVCQEEVVGFHEPRVVTNVDCVSVVIEPLPEPGLTNICVTNVIPNPLRVMTNVLCADAASFTGGDSVPADGCKTNVVVFADLPEFITNVFCETVVVPVVTKVAETRLICVTNVLVDPTPRPIIRLVCQTNLVPDPNPEPIIEEVCVTNVVSIPGGQVFTNIFVTNLVRTTNISCTNLVIRPPGDTNVIELPIDDFLNRPPFWGKSLLITDLSVVEDPLRTWDPCQPDRGTRLGAWTFGRLMTDMCNQAATGLDPSDFTRRWLRSWQHDLSINFDTVTNRNLAIVAQVINDWEQASGGPGAPLDLSIAPFRLLAIVNRVDLRGNPGYGGVNSDDPCNPSCIGGEGRFVFALVPGLRRTGGGGGGYGGGGPDIIQSSCDASEFTVIFEYCVPKRTCEEIKQYAMQWYALSQLEFGAGFNAALQAITDQFAAAGADPARKPNLSALNQLRANELLVEPWDLREWRLFNNDSDAGWLREVTVKQTPDFGYNFGERIVQFCLENAGLILAEQHSVPLQFKREPFLGGDAPMPTAQFFWDGPQPTGAIPGEVRHKFSLNTCNGCHAGETGTPFTHVFPRAFGQEARLSDFLTGQNMPKLDPADQVTERFFTDLKRREDDLLRLIKEPCFFQLFHEPLRFEH